MHEAISRAIYDRWKEYGLIVLNASDNIYRAAYRAYFMLGRGSPEYEEWINHLRTCDGSCS